MTRYLRIFIIFIICLAWAVAQDGTRAKSLSGAFSSITGDIEAFHYNPAGIAGTDESQVQVSYNPIYPGVADIRNISVGYLQPFVTVNDHKIAAVSAHYNNFVIDDIVSVDTFALALATSFKFIKFLQNNRILTDILIGAKIKYVNTKYIYESEYDDILFAGGNSKGWFSIGAGLTVKLLQDLGIGFFANNLNMPDQGMLIEDIVPMVIGAGLSYKKTWETLSILGSGGWEYEDSVNSLKAGAELGLFKMVFLRAGIKYPVLYNMSISAGAGFYKKIGKVGLGLDGTIVFVPAVYNSVSRIHNYSISLLVTFSI